MSIAFAIKGLSVQAISHNEIAVLLECETLEEAKQLDYALDGYSIGWDDKNEDNVSFFLRAPRIGSYQFDVDIRQTKLIKDATLLCAAYRLETGQLEPLPSRLLNLIYPPKNQRPTSVS